MKKFMMKKFGLTENGIKAVEKSSFAALLTNFGYMAFMMIAMYFGDSLLKEPNQEPLKYLLIIVITAVVTYVFVDIEYVKSYNSTYKEAKELRIEIADRLKELPLSYFSKHDLSDVAQTIMQDVADIERAMSHAMPKLIGNALFISIILVLMFISNATLALATAAPLGIGFLLVLIPRKLQDKWQSKYFWRTRENSETFQEAIELQREIKSYDLVGKISERASSVLDDSEKMRIISEITLAIPMLTSISVMKISLGTVSLVSAALLKANAVELIYVIGFILASVRLVDAIGAAEEFLLELVYIDSRVKRINELREIDLQSGEDFDPKHFDIELKNVEFGYNDELKVVNGVDFTAKQNEVTAIVGPSGCGKSTILRLISRLYDYENGEIIIDGKDIKKISTDSLFDKISFVFQDVILFNASVMDNIRMGRMDATEEEVKEAARLANCEEFINKLPDGYNTLIGENGGNLSGGERQRISIARAFLKNAPILLLDEISASLDVENELKIQESLNKLIENKTVIIVSHRLKSIEKADKIVVMNEGKVEAMGNHSELVKSSELYKNLLKKSNLTEEFMY